MANHGFQKFQAYENSAIVLFAEVDIAASGISVLDRGLGVSSVTKETASGTYNVQLEGNYNHLLAFDGTVQSATPVACDFQLKAEQVTESGSLQFYTLSGTTPVNVPSGTSFHLSMHLKNVNVR